VPKVGKTGDDVAAHAQRLQKCLNGFQRFLKGLTEDDVVETIVGVVRQSLVEVAVIHGHTFGHSVVDLFLDEFDARAPHALALRKHLEEGAPAAAEIEHPGPSRDLVDDEQVVPPHTLRIPGDAASHV
jgi:hypothetical protein